MFWFKKINIGSKKYIYRFLLSKCVLIIDHLDANEWTDGSNLRLYKTNDAFREHVCLNIVNLLF